MKKSTKAALSLLMAASFTFGAAALPQEYSCPISTVCAEAAAKLPAPENISFSVSANSVTITWDELKGADAYRIYMYNESEKKYAVYKNVSGTACKVTDLTKNKTYYFKVAALVEKNGKYTEQTRSAQITAKTKSASLPASPSANYTGFASSGNKKYYFDNGKACVGFKQINKKYYYFTDEGVMVTGWLNYYGRYYYFYSDGIMAAGVSLKFGDKTYTFNGNGVVKWYSDTEEPVASYTIMGEEPNIYLDLSSKTKYSSVVGIGVTNKGNKSVKIYKVGELIDSTTSSFDRTLGLAFCDDEEVTDFRDMTIKPGVSSYLGWVCVPDDTWYDKKTIIKFYFKYDNVCYLAVCSDYYGSYYEVLHFDLDNT